ncbi:MAG: hypothetical protein COB98_04360 [Flavobacteriaceae bacterium]|nr:MAG: hypothetical protein COB98_04360 [Flavobacteriaceae bacterium]
MIKRGRAQISKFIIHKVGNKFNSSTNAFSDKALEFDQETYELMLPFLLKPFTNVAESFRFNHHADIALNEINSYTKQVFEDGDSFVEVSQNIVTHLFEQSNSAQIKRGDVLIAFFEDIEYRDVMTTAIGIFKIESKSSFFQTYMDDSNFDIMLQQGISTKRIDKGCLIINSTDDEGRTVLSVDNNNYDAQYWIKNFLNVKYADDANQHTNTYIEMCKDFSDQVIQEEFGLHEKNKFLASTVDFFNENDHVNINTFKEEVFESEGGRMELFEDYKKQYEEANDVLVRNDFVISDVVLKKQKTKMKTEIKLDTHIQIKLDIDAPDAYTEYIEQGFDEEKKMKFYKVFYNEEK